MRSKLVVTIFTVVCCVVFLMGSQGEFIDGFPVLGIELPEPPPPPDTMVPGDEDPGPQPSRVMACAGNVPGWVNCGGKLFMNYDFTEQSINQCKTDWPVMVIFYGNATINKVKNIYWGQTILGNSMNGAYDIGSGTQWDTDRGTKGGVTFGGPDGNDSDNLHLRLYAPPGTDYFDGSGGWGHYVIATAHFDFNPPWDTVVGYSEDAEHKALSIAASKGYTVYYDYTWISNAESLRNESNHWWQSDGYVSLVYVP